MCVLIRRPVLSHRPFTESTAWSWGRLRAGPESWKICFKCAKQRRLQKPAPEHQAQRNTLGYTGPPQCVRSPELAKSLGHNRKVDRVPPEYPRLPSKAEPQLTEAWVQNRGVGGLSESGNPKDVLEIKVQSHHHLKNWVVKHRGISGAVNTEISEQFLVSVNKHLKLLENQVFLKCTISYLPAFLKSADQ